MSSTNDVLNEHFLFLFLMNNFVQQLPHLCLLCLAVKLVKLHLKKKRKGIHVKLAEPETDFNLTEGASQILEKHVLGIVVYLVGQKSWLGCGPRGLGLGTPAKLSPSVSVLCWTDNLSLLKPHLLPMTDGSKRNRLYWWCVNQGVCGLNLLFHPCRHQEWRPGWKEPKGLLWRQGRDRRLWRLVKPPNIPSFLFREHISKFTCFFLPQPQAHTGRGAHMGAIVRQANVLSGREELLPTVSPHRVQRGEHALLVSLRWVQERSEQEHHRREGPGHLRGLHLHLVT